MAPTQFTVEQLRRFTDGFHFSDRRHQGQLTGLYKGEIDGEEVDVKVYDTPQSTLDKKYWENEITVLKKIQHQNIIKLVGYADDGRYCTVYEHMPSTLAMVFSDCFTWHQRIKVAVVFARLVEYLHIPIFPCGPYLGLNIDASHIMLDQDYNLQLFDFGTLSGGVLSDRTRNENFGRYYGGCHGYYDNRGSMSEKADVFAYGIVLLGLIAKHVYNPEIDIHPRENPDAYYVDTWARENYQSKSIQSCRPHN